MVLDISQSLNIPVSLQGRGVFMAEKKEGKEPAKDSKDANLTRILLDNNIALQKKSMSLIESSQVIAQHSAILVKKLDTLSNRIDKMLGVFEEASKHVMDAGEDRRVIELADKLEELLEQNRILTKGLMMLENYVKTRTQFDRV